MHSVSYRQKTLTTKEWGLIRLGENGLSEEQVDRLQKTAEKAAGCLHLHEGAVLTRVVNGLKAGQVCGVVSTQDRAVEILPKIEGLSGAESKHALIRMLSVAHDLNVSDSESAFLATQRHDLLELLIQIFVRRLKKAMQAGLQRQYRTNDEELPFVRGTLKVVQQLTKRPVAPTQLYCQFDDLSEDTPLNRLLKAASTAVLGISRTQETQRELHQILDGLRYVGKSENALNEPVQLDRSTAAFKDLVPLARLLLTGNWQSTTSGETTGTSLLFPMNELFERYVARRAQQTIGSEIVRKQHAKHHVLVNKLFRMIPDLVFDYPSGPVIVDTKWKSLDITDQKKLGVAQSDVYQMLAYGHGYSNDSAKPRLVLLYPHPSDLGTNEGILRNWVLSGSGLPLSICSVDISRRRSPAEWRDFFQKIAPAKASKTQTVAI